MQLRPQVLCLCSAGNIEKDSATGFQAMSKGEYYVTGFAQFWNIYKDAFPQEERRDPDDYKTDLLKDPYYRFVPFFDGGNMIGFVSLWDLDAFLFIEHFAVHRKLRGNGYGTRILRRLLGNGRDACDTRDARGACDAVSHGGLSSSSRPVAGSKALAGFGLSSVPSPRPKIVLEVEPPEGSLAKKRIRFYKRMGFHLNGYHYVQPPYRLGEHPVPLKLMSYPKPIHPNQIKTVTKRIYRHVYRLQKAGPEIR